MPSELLLVEDQQPFLPDLLSTHVSQNESSGLRSPQISKVNIRTEELVLSQIIEKHQKGTTSKGLVVRQLRKSQ